MIDERGDSKIRVEEKGRLPGLGIGDENHVEITLPLIIDRPEIVRFFHVTTTQEGKTEFMVNMFKGLSAEQEQKYKTERAGRHLLRLQIPSEPVADEGVHEEQFGLPRTASVEEIDEAYIVASKALEEVRATGDSEQIAKHQRLVNKLQSALVALPK